MSLPLVLTIDRVLTYPSACSCYRSVLNAIVLALLWIKVLGFLKFVNKEMATFIMALNQVEFNDVKLPFPSCYRDLNSPPSKDYCRHPVFHGASSLVDPGLEFAWVES